MSNQIFRVLTLASILCPACAPEDEGDVGSRMGGMGTGSGTGGGTVFNTNVLDEDALSEVLQPLGTSHYGMALSAVTLKHGTTLAHFSVEDGVLVGYDKKGKAYDDVALLQSRWSFNAATTKPAGMRLAERVDVDGWPHYRFTEEWQGEDTCVSDDGPVYARLLSGFTLDELTGAVTSLADNTYVACTNGATGKAATWGFYDLAVGEGDWKIFEVAIRMIRADYCYDGVSFTHAGVSMAYEDRWHAADPSDLPVEAVWGADGLLCRGQGRSLEVPKTCGEVAVPACEGEVSFATYPEALFITHPGELDGSIELPGS
jgi:hypothetical protein